MVAEYFGERWPSGTCDEGVQVRTPVGEHCDWCQTPVMEGDRGLIMWTQGLAGTYPVPMHRECHLRTVMGSVAHMEGRCSCRTGDWSNRPQTPSEVRQEALELWEWIERRRHADGDA